MQSIPTFSNEYQTSLVTTFLLRGSLRSEVYLCPQSWPVIICIYVFLSLSCSGLFSCVLVDGRIRGQCQNNYLIYTLPPVKRFSCPHSSTLHYSTGTQVYFIKPRDYQLIVILPANQRNRTMKQNINFRVSWIHRGTY